jgi:nucleotide-binding universal stress UspA family protein
VRNESHALNEMEFQRIVCGVDASEESLEAARQAARLAAPGAQLVIVTVAEVDVAALAGFLAVRAAAELEREAEAALERVRTEVLDVQPAETRFVRGRDPAATLAEFARDSSTVLCVGAHGYGRARGMALGRVSTRLLREASCSVLVARPPRDPAGFPAGIAVGVDGSPRSEQALAVARSLRERSDASLRVVAATASKSIDLAVVATMGPDVETRAEKAVDVLVAVSSEVDLLVLGHRGLHGARALGSVSERVAHQAKCSVLVVQADP